MSASLGGSTLTKRGLRPAIGTIEVDALDDDQMDVKIELKRTSKTLDKRYRLLTAFPSHKATREYLVPVDRGEMCFIMPISSDVSVQKCF